MYLFLESNEPFPTNDSIIQILKITDENVGKIRILILFIHSLLISKSSISFSNACVLQEMDIEMLISDEDSLHPFSLIQKLQFIRRVLHIEDNKSLLKTEPILQLVCSAFALDSDVNNEQARKNVEQLASEILTSLCDDDDPVEESSDHNPVAALEMSSIADTIPALLDDMANHVQEATEGYSSEDRGLRICSSLQYILENLSRLSESVIAIISSYPYTVNVFCIYLKLHLDHVG